MSDHYRHQLAGVADSEHPFPAGRFAGRGVVICGGGEKYFPCAWVCLRMLRHLGCRLPIELWHLGPGEVSAQMQGLVGAHDVRCVDAFEVRRQFPVRRLNGWELKPYAILHSAFAQVMLLDADNVPARDPSYLFDEPEFKRLGAMFWPDRWRRPGDPHAFLQPSAWAECGLEFREGPEFESGQVLVDKQRCWRPLQLTMFINENSEHYYRHFYGDKDTYRLAWLRCGHAYAMPATPVATSPGTEVFYQHDMAGRVVFQHRLVKWQLDGPNYRHRSFAGEATCLGFLDELRAAWSERRAPASGSDAAAALARLMEIRRFRYERVGHDWRLMELLPDGTIGLGAARLERTWTVHVDGAGRSVLTIAGQEGVICRLREGDGGWRGHWTQFERMPIVLSPADRSPAQDEGETVAGAAARVGQARVFEYRRIGHDHRLLELRPDGTIGQGAARLERAWTIVAEAPGRPALHLYGDEGLICSLEPGPDGSWSGRWTQFEKMPVVLAPGPAREPTHGP